MPSSPPSQEVVCCLGQPVAGNPTQYMMEKAFGAAGLEDWKYLTCEVPPETLAWPMAPHAEPNTTWGTRPAIEDRNKSAEQGTQ